MGNYGIFDLTDKVAIVTGGAGHLGYAMTEGLLEAGAIVYIAGMDVTKRRNAVDKLAIEFGKRVREIAIDIRSIDLIKKCFNDVTSEAGGIDILVNNAAFAESDELESISEEFWNKGIDGTINSVFRCTQSVIPFLRKNGYGSIINIASMYGMVSPDPSIYGDSGFNNPPNYGAGKAAIIQFTRFAACHLAKYKIRVNTVSPGPFPSAKVQENCTFISNLNERNPQGRIGKPEDLKGIIVLLASQASSYITGVNIPVDGGWTAW